MRSFNFLFVPQTLYVIRPAVYSLFLYRCNKKSTERGGHLRQSQRKGNVLLALAVSMVKNYMVHNCSQCWRNLTLKAVMYNATVCTIYLGFGGVVDSMYCESFRND